MNRILIALTILVVTSAIHAKGMADNTSIQTWTYADGIEFQLSAHNTDLQLNVMAPDKSMFSKRFIGNKAMFLEITDNTGATLADGLYKYEAWPLPAVIISREESAKMPDRNSLDRLRNPTVERISGTFRIDNGMLVNPNLVEYEMQLPAENLK